MNRKDLLGRLHRNGFRSSCEATAAALLFSGFAVLSIVTWNHGLWPATLLCWLLQAHFAHTNLLAFHEAAHFLLCRVRWLNDLQGIVVGTTILLPLSVYRWAHAQHHKHLATEEDVELWPYVDPSVPRWGRFLAAGAELLCGFFYTPVLFLRAIVIAPRVPRPVVRRIALEYFLCVAVWAAIIVAVWHLQLWVELVVGYLVPALLAGNFQSLRKFTEHVGLLGDDVPSTTRTVVDQSLLGRVLSASMLHVDLHGTHHRYARIPHFHLHEATALVYRAEIQARPGANVFPSYLAAMSAMFKTLGNPRVGAQWCAGSRRLTPEPMPPILECSPANHAEAGQGLRREA